MMPRPADSLDDERRACVQWATTLLADPNRLADHPEPASSQLDAAVWALLTSYHATLAAVAPEYLPDMGRAALSALYDSRAMESAGLVRVPQLSARPGPPAKAHSPAVDRALVVLRGFGVGLIAWFIFIGFFATFLIIYGIVRG